MMNYVLSVIDAAPTGFNFSIDANTVMLALIAGLISMVAWFTRKWCFAIEAQIGSIHTDMKEHNDKSDQTHERVFKALALDAKRIAYIEGKLKVRED